MPDPAPLTYAPQQPGRRHGSLGIAAFAVSILAAAVPDGRLAWVFYQHAIRMSPGGWVFVKVDGIFLMGPTLAMGLAITALLRRSRRFFPVAAIVQAGVTAVTLVMFKGQWL